MPNSQENFQLKEIMSRMSKLFEEKEEEIVSSFDNQIKK